MTRSAGILLHVTSLPSPFGIGDLGKEAYDFVDLLAAAHVRTWQVLPLQPTGYGDSPYASVCATALNPYLIDLRTLLAKGLLTEDEVDRARVPVGPVDYATLFATRYPLLRTAFSRFDRTAADFVSIRSNACYADFAAYMALKTAHGFASPDHFVPAFRNAHSPETLAFLEQHRDEVDFWLWTQYEFLNEWSLLRAYANERNVCILGDIPLYVAGDSAEVWAHPELFRLNDNGSPDPVAGVPPDYFSATGQLWGNPVYHWARMREDGYSWWHARIAHAFSLYDALRIDHFRGFDRYYTVPLGSPDARNGQWEQGPGMELFAPHNGKRIVAEDLGMIDDGVRKLLADTGYPGMRVVSFGLDGSADNTNRPTLYPENVVGYTGTHDNMPLLGLVQSMSETERAAAVAVAKEEARALGVRINVQSDTALCSALTRIGLASKAHLFVLPWQDVVGGDASTRMNTPGDSSGNNWTYRAQKSDFCTATVRKLSRLLHESKRD